MHKPDHGAVGRQPSPRFWLLAVFLSPAEPRLRAGWRLTLQVVLQAALTVLTGFFVVLAVPELLHGQFEALGATAILAAEIAELATVTGSIYISRRILDRRSFKSLGLAITQTAFLDLVAGLGITFLMMGSVFAIERSLGWLQVTGFAWQQQAVGSVLAESGLFLAICLIVGWNEELMSRGYHLQTIASGTTLFVGWMISSAVFAMLHLANPHANFMAVLGIVIAGLFLGFAYIRTGRLWLSMGLHAGWNFFEGVVFGFPVSGLDFYRITEISVSGPALWTGGPFGPEAGLVLIPAAALGFVMIHLYANGLGRPSS